MLTEIIILSLFFLNHLSFLKFVHFFEMFYHLSTLFFYQKFTMYVNNVWLQASAMLQLAVH